MPASTIEADKGYRIDIEIPTDRMVPRDRKSRLLSAVAVGTLMIATPALFCGYWGSLVSPTASEVGEILGAFVGSVSYLWVFAHKIFLYNNEYSGYVTQNPFPNLLNFVDKGVDQNDGMEIYAAGPHLTHFWEQRNRKGNYPLKVTTQVIEVSVPTKTSKVTVTVYFEYMEDIRHLDRAIAADNDTVIMGYQSYIASFLTQELSKMEASEAVQADDDLNQKLCSKFMGIRDKSGRKFSKFETQYGIKTVSLVVSNIKLPEDVQTTRDAIEEGKEIHKIAAAILGVTPEELTKMQTDGKIEPKLMIELRKEALAMSKNATMSIVDIEGTSGSPIAVIGGNGTQPLSQHV